MLKPITSSCAIVALCIAAPARAAPDPEVFTRQVDTFVESEMRAEHVPGVAVAVLRDGQIVLAKGYGRATLEHPVPVTAATMFESGSLGKMFTAAAVMTQVERGKLRLEDPIGKYLPDVPESWRAITVRHLLTHTSGVAEYTARVDLRRDYTDDEMIRMAYSLPLDFKPGARWSYSNTGYTLLGILLKRATGRSYLEIIDTEIFKPLGMKTARGISEADIIPNRASGYELVHDALNNQDWVSPTLNTTADGSLYLSLNDMIAWSRGVEHGAILSRAGWKQVYTPVRLNSGKPYPYGFGWFLDQAGGKPRFHHGGAWQGFRTYYSRYLGDGLSIILLGNSASTNLNAFVDGIAARWDGNLVSSGAPPKPAPEAARRATALIELARAAALRAADLPLAREGFAEAANARFAPMLKALGPLTALTLVSRRELGDDIEYIFAARFGDQSKKVTLIVAPGDRPSLFLLS